MKTNKLSQFDYAYWQRIDISKAINALESTIYGKEINLVETFLESSVNPFEIKAYQRGMLQDALYEIDRIFDDLFLEVIENKQVRCESCAGRQRCAAHKHIDLKEYDERDNFPYWKEAH